MCRNEIPVAEIREQVNRFLPSRPEVIHRESPLLATRAHFWHNMAMSDEKTPVQQPKPAITPDPKGILRRLQGEDGYDIFEDRKTGDDRDRLQRERDDNRW